MKYLTICVNMKVKSLLINYDGLYNKEYFDTKFNDNHFSKNKLNYALIKNCTLLPYMDINSNLFGGIIDSKGKFWDGSLVHRGIGGGYNFDVIPKKFSDAVYMGTLSNVWGALYH